jgi:poly(3-hydroxyalkanoate) synthetase
MYYIMSNIKVLISGPIRPNIKYVNYLIEYIKNMINQDITIFLCYWDNEKIEKSMFKYVDYILNEKEPEDEEIEQYNRDNLEQSNTGHLEYIKCFME